MTEMTTEQIQAALAAGIISQTQADKMRGLKKTPSSDENNSVIGNEDDMRFFRSFSDVFISIGLGLLCLGLFASFLMMGGGQLFLIPAAIMVLLAEYFGRKKRQHLPTLVTALAFLWFIQMGIAGLVKKLGMGGDITVALITVFAMLTFYWRVRLPFCMALIAIALLYLVYSILISIAPDFIMANIGWAFFIGGAVTLTAAILYDLKDQHRTTRFADNAFWLHFTAAPLIIHGLAIEFVSVKSEKVMNLVNLPSLDQGDAAIVMIMVGVLAVFGMAINRRGFIGFVSGVCRGRYWIFNAPNRP